MSFILALCLLAQNSAAGVDDTLREWVYQAEVFGRVASSLNGLERMLIQKDADRAAVTAAIAQVKFARPRPGDPDGLLLGLRAPEALVTFAGKYHILAGDHWLESGDWIDDHFLLAVEQGRIILQTREGARSDILLREPLPTSPTGNSCYLRDAPQNEVLKYFARQASLNSFIPSELSNTLSGTYTFSDWLGLLDSICHEADIGWRRINNNVVFTSGTEPQAENMEILQSLERKNQNVLEFIENLARRFDLELIIDVPHEELANIQVDIYAQEQTWDETLDCLAVMKGFRWSVDRSEQPKLVITPP